MKNILCLFLLAVTFAAQAQIPVNDLLSHIPADADQVTDINLGTIASKMDLHAVLNLLGSKAGKDKSLSMIQQLVMSSGLDIRQHLIITKTNSKKVDSIQYFTVIAHITDSAKLVAFLRAKAKEAGGEPLHFVHLQNKERVVASDKDAAAWNDHVAVLMMYTVPRSANGPLVPLATARLKAARRVAAALHGFSDTKFVTDNHFASTFSDDGDAHLWSRAPFWTTFVDKLSKKMPGMDKFGNLSQLSKANTGGQSISTLRFENGRISYRTLKFADAKTLAAIQRTLGQGLSSELLALVPPRPLLAVASIHLDMAVIEDTLKHSPAFPMIDTMMQGKGISVTDILHALRGDFLFLVCQPDKTTADTTGKKTPSPALFLVATINDKAAFEKIAPMIKSKNANTAAADTMTTDTAHKKNPFPYYLEQNDLVVLGKRHQIMEFANDATTGDPVGKLLPEQVRANTVNAGIDIHALVTALFGPMLTAAANNQDPKSKAMMDMIQTFQTLQISVGAIRDDAMETDVELKLVDQNKNSLTILTNIIAGLAGKSGGGQTQ